MHTIRLKTITAQALAHKKNFSGIRFQHPSYSFALPNGIFLPELVRAEKYYSESHYRIDLVNCAILLLPTGCGHINYELLCDDFVVTCPFKAYYYFMLRALPSYIDYDGNILTINVDHLSEVEYSDIGLFIGGSGNWGHLLKDILPNALLQRPDKLSFIDYNTYDDSIFQILNIKNRLSLRCTTPTLVRFSKGSICTMCPHPLLRSIYSRYLNAVPNRHRRVFLYKSIGTERIANTGEVFQLCKERHIEVIDPTKISLTSLLTILSQTTLLIINTDAAAQNALFTHQETNIIFLTSKEWVNSVRPDIQWALDILLSAPSASVIVGSQVAPGESPISAQYTIPIPQLSKAISQFE
jgi:hypothetical protein